MDAVEHHSIKLLSNFHYIVEISNGKVERQSFKIGLPFYNVPRIIEIEPTSVSRQYFENMFQFLNECPPAFTREDYEKFMNSDKGRSILPNLYGLEIDGINLSNNQWVIKMRVSMDDHYLADLGMEQMSIQENKCWRKVFPSEETIELTNEELKMVQHYIRICLFKYLLDYPYNTFKAPFIIPQSPFVLDVAQAQGWIK